MQQQYPIKVQSIRAKGRKERPFVSVPVPLAVAIGLQQGENVQWELVSNRELRLIRLDPNPPEHAKKDPAE